MLVTTIWSVGPFGPILPALKRAFYQKYHFILKFEADRD